MFRWLTLVKKIVQSGGGGGGNPWTDTPSFKFNFADAVAAPTDAVSEQVTLNNPDTIAAPTETVTLKFPSPPDFTDGVAAPTEVRTFNMRIWLNGTVAQSANGVTNPGNADGQNDGAVCTIQSTIGGVVNPSIKSFLGNHVPSGVSIASAKYRGWFKSVNTLITSNGRIDDISNATNLFFNSALNTTIDHSSGDFLFDLIAAGYNLALLKTMVIVHQTNDVAAGVTPHVLTVDAGCIELAGAF